MDSVYKFEKQPLLNIYSEFEKIRSELNKNIGLPQCENEIKTAIKFQGTDEEFKQLEDSISIKHLSQDDDVTVLKFDERNKIRRRGVVEIPKKALRLQTFREILRIRKQSNKRGSCFGMSEFSFKRVKKSSDDTLTDRTLLTPYEDVLISIRFYRPYRLEYGAANERPRFAEEFLVLGNNTLAQLRDKIFCICNNRQLLDVSEDIYQESVAPKANSGFFFITDTFYNDTRSPENHDYSHVIRKWLKDKKEFEGTNFRVASMENTKFIDLTARLGFPQVYQHHGNCEHLFAFSSVQLLSPQDDLCLENYPILNSMSIPRTILCHICATRVYTFVVMKSTRQFHDPTYLCRACFESYYYVNGQKIGEFVAYQLNPDEILETIPAAEKDDEDK